MVSHSTSEEVMLPALGPSPPVMLPAALMTAMRLPPTRPNVVGRTLAYRSSFTWTPATKHDSDTAHVTVRASRRNKTL